MAGTCVGTKEVYGCRAGMCGAWCRAQGYIQCKASIDICMGLCVGMHRSCVQAVLNLSLSVGTRTDPPSLLA